VTPLTRATSATSAELGLCTRIATDWESSPGVFLLKLRSELVLDGDAGVTVPRRCTAGHAAGTLARGAWNDIEYYYVSRLRNEPSPLPDCVVHPGVPRTLRARVGYRFD
jgi:hypothetical protein